MTNKKFDFTPESIEKLKARYEDAVMFTWVHGNPNDSPGQHKEHIFDCEDGICLIINKELLGPIDIIHFSCTIQKDVYEKNTQKKFAGIINAELLAKFEQRFREISDEITNKKPFHLLTIDPMHGTPHFLVVEQGMEFGMAWTGNLPDFDEMHEANKIPPLGGNKPPEGFTA